MSDAPPKSADALVAELAAGGVAEAGAFTLDRDLARAKLAEFRLPDARLYLLQLVSGLIVRGARRVSVSYDIDDLWVVGDGEPLTEEDLEHLYGALFASGRDATLRARRELAVGLHAAEGIGAKWIRVTSRFSSGVESEGVSLRVVPGQPDEYGPAPRVAEHFQVKDMPPALAALARTVIQVRTSIGQTGADRAKGLIGVAPREVALLAERARFAEIALSIQGQDRAPVALADGLVEPVYLEASGTRGVVGVVDDPTLTRTELEILQHGIVRAVVEVDALPGCRARIEAADLERDLSQFDFARDDAFAAVLDAVKAARATVLAQVARPLRLRRDPDRPQEASTRRHLRRAVSFYHAEIVEGRIDEPWLAPLVDAYVWPCLNYSAQTGGVRGAADLFLSTREVLARAEEGLSYAKKLPAPGEDLPPWLLLLAEEEDRRALPAILAGRPRLTEFGGKSEAEESRALVVRVVFAVIGVIVALATVVLLIITS